MSLLGEVVGVFLPLWATNLGLVVFGAVKHRWHIPDAPFDFEARCGDAPLVGPNRTWGGLGVALGVGLATGMFQGRLVFGMVAGVGAFLGTVLGSFVKRRLGRPPGTRLIVVDEVDFALVGVLAASLIEPVSLPVAIFGIGITLVLHRPVSWLGHRLGMKRVPW